MRRRWLLVLTAVVVTLLNVPTSAYAEDFASSFASGLETTLTGEAKNELVTPEKDYIEGYEPEPVKLNAAPAAQPETTQGNIEWVTNAFNSVPWGSGTYAMVTWLKAVLGGTSSAESKTMRVIMITAPIGLCFMWWGVRYVIARIMAAYRRGAMHL